MNEETQKYAQKSIPGMMQIINAVCKVAKVSSAGIMGKTRDNYIISARSAIFHIASTQGYQLPEIMDYLNLRRTVGYNYQKKIKGHLQRDPEFLAIVDAAMEELGRVRPRALMEIKPELEQTGEDPEENTPKPYESPLLGWRFTAEDMEIFAAAIARANEYMVTIK